MRPRLKKIASSKLKHAASYSSAKIVSEMIRKIGHLVLGFDANAWDSTKIDREQRPCEDKPK